MSELLVSEEEGRRLGGGCKVAGGAVGPGGRLPVQVRLLRQGQVLALGNHLQEALETYSVALSDGALRPEHLSTLVDCVLLGYKRRDHSWCRRGEQPSQEGDPPGCAAPTRPAGELMSCRGCRGFLAEPVTAPCGHSYCRRCLWKGLLSRCKVCRKVLAGQPSLPLKTTVVLGQLAEKWFPAETWAARQKSRIDELLGAKKFQEALDLSNQVIESDPSDVTLRACRAEAYVGLQQYRSAIEDLDVVHLKLPTWPEACFKKAKVLHAVGCVDESFQLFLQCLALDEDFAPAKLELEKDVKGLRESTWNSLPYLRSKTSVTDHQTGGACSHLQACIEKIKVPKNVEEPVEAGVSQAHSGQTLHVVEKRVSYDCLKRVLGTPWLAGQEKGTLLKRKLSTSEQDLARCGDGKNKYIKQGETSEANAPLPYCREVLADLIDVSDFECSLCMRLFFEPVTTPCGHTFCKKCLERCLDYKPRCPLCKESLGEYLANRKYTTTQLLEELIVNYLPDDFLERQKLNNEEREELSNLTKNVPMFVCTMAYPTVPCPLHVFEPRYRLMIRRCIETGTKQFGMCISDPQKGFADYGCMLQIQNVIFMPDGRSVVDTVGGRRFRVLQRGMRDGYYVADIDYLEDEKMEGEEELRKLQELHDQTYTQAHSWFQSLRNRFRNQILQHFGSMPEQDVDLQASPNGPAWCWWLLAVLPVDPRYQLSVLSMISLKERLVKIQYILTCFSREQSK
ncbi:LON peptidase N-terminal domain and ring finger 1, like isoform X2 [Latimeria chalumnae]|uniref:LON peptidase N-terminal domain and ring finger 1, like isoform X2 n=1 Tax=Latimeria chalumnae TaxID=7897 RepID=UPI0003C14053|nr:PREDICTED: LON peptidase N-terminal domain and RING finger protein 1 isoform X2 [Latimeria chalumnae]|eukprot:XP_006000235.1 PREDICTED: LON peptidase N-terminal domain and RING finger protein 1 isoform X2 [Latimeria chalumnae]